MLFLLKKLVVVFTFVVIVVRTKAFQPQNKAELKSAVDACVANDSTGMSCMKNDVHISQWDVSKVTNMGNMFRGASSFNGDLSSWDVSKVTDMSSMFCGSGFQHKLQWDCKALTSGADNICACVCSCNSTGASSLDKTAAATKQSIPLFMFVTIWLMAILYCL